LVIDAVAAERGDSVEVKRSRLADMFRDRKMYILSLAYISTIAGTQAVALWTPTILRKLGFGMTQIGFLSAAPYVVSAIAMLLVGRSSDRFMERRWHFAVPIAAAGICLAALSAEFSSAVVTTLLLTCATAGAWMAIGVFWTIPPTELSAGAKAGGIAFISSAGSIGGFVSPVIVGHSNALTGSIYGGFIVIGCMLVASGAVVLLCTRKNPVGNLRTDSATR
jgi:ACS family phthalate transporter-like MFS transporter